MIFKVNSHAWACSSSSTFFTFSLPCSLWRQVSTEKPGLPGQRRQRGYGWCTFEAPRLQTLMACRPQPLHWFGSCCHSVLRLNSSALVMLQWTDRSSQQNVLTTYFYANLHLQNVYKEMCHWTHRRMPPQSCHLYSLLALLLHDTVVPRIMSSPVKDHFT